MLLKDRIALVTGASRGIGAATARLLARHGAAVAVNYFGSAEKAAAVVQDITADGGKALAVKADVRDRTQVEAMRDAVESGLGSVDTLVLNANIHFPIVPFLEFPWEGFRDKVLGEMAASFHPCQVFAPAMAERGSGCIIAVSSGLSRMASDGFCAHSSAKSGLDAFARSLARELGPRGIRVNVVAPGLTDTDATAQIPQGHKDAVAAQTPLRRIGRPEDAAGAILALALEETGFVTGSYVPVSGGELMP